jgi:hypothetical protein
MTRSDSSGRVYTSDLPGAWSYRIGHSTPGDWGFTIWDGEGQERGGGSGYPDEDAAHSACCWRLSDFAEIAAEYEASRG